MAANDAVWTADCGNEEEDKEEEEEEVGIPKDNMFSLEAICWTYTFLPHKFSQPNLHTAENLPHHAAYFNTLDSALQPHIKVSPLSHLRVASIIASECYVYDIPRF